MRAMVASALDSLRKGGPMVQQNAKLEPGDWEVTSVTLHCGFINNYVVIRVAQDWVAQCVWFQIHKVNQSPRSPIKNLGKKDQCAGPECPIVKGYKEKLMKEEGSSQVDERLS
jgi:hypothetical protein